MLFTQSRIHLSERVSAESISSLQKRKRDGACVVCAP